MNALDTEEPTVMYWMGRPIEELSKEELIQALKMTHQSFVRASQAHMRSLDMWRAFREARR